MSLKKLSAFIREDIEADENGKKPDRRTVLKWPCIVKMNDRYYADMSKYRASIAQQSAANDVLSTLLQDEEVARLVG